MTSSDLVWSKHRNTLKATLFLGRITGCWLADPSQGRPAGSTPGLTTSSARTPSTTSGVWPSWDTSRLMLPTTASWWRSSDNCRTERTETIYMKYNYKTGYENIYEIIIIFYQKVYIWSRSCPYRESTKPPRWWRYMYVVNSVAIGITHSFHLSKSEASV